MERFNIITRWFWAICIVVTFLNAGIYRFKARRRIKEHPELAESYNALIWGFALWGNIPWIVMGIGMVFGGVPTVFHFFRPQDGNPFVLAFFISVITLWILGTYWLFFRGGAQLIVDHPGIFNVNTKRTWVVKLYWILCLAGGIMGIVMMLTQNFQVPFK
jgi:hypothetical protein